MKEKPKQNSHHRITKCARNSEISQEYIPDLLAIFDFLNEQTPLIEKYLKQLEAALQHNAADKKYADLVELSADEKYILRINKQNPVHYGKLFTDYIYAWAAENGFKNKGKVRQELLPAEFYTLLRTHTIFKDNAPETGNEHGAWSHALQWYCIIEHQKQSGFLTHSPQEIYAALAANTKDPDYKDGNLWLLLFDEYESCETFNCPEMVYSFITDSSRCPQWPLLAESLKRREAKILVYGDQYLSNNRTFKAGEEIVIKSLR